jgi:ATP-dependent DNA helicase RecG
MIFITKIIWCHWAICRSGVSGLQSTVCVKLLSGMWTRALEVEVVAYANRLEILSPGVLQNSMRVEKVLAGQRSPRNPILVEVLRDYGYVDARGMGVRNKIVPLMREVNGAELVIDATEDHVLLVLPNRVPGVGTSVIT